MKLLPEFLAGIDYLMTKAEELKIREKLVVVIQSEMGRGPNTTMEMERTTGRLVQPCLWEPVFRGIES